tara:strand:+ start:30 stop:224 length:195 start_codon:yes stop_codon:yes gene_type:complete
MSINSLAEDEYQGLTHDCIVRLQLDIALGALKKLASSGETIAIQALNEMKTVVDIYENTDLDAI